MSADRIALLVRGYRREVMHRRLLTWACRLGSVFLAGLFCYLVMVLGYGDAFYITLSLVAIVHGLSAYGILFYYEVPGLVRALHDPDPALADDAWAAIERLRPELLPRLFIDLDVPPDRRADLVSAIDRPTLAGMTAARTRDRWRTIGPIYLVVYVLALSAYLYLVFTHVPELVH